MFELGSSLPEEIMTSGQLCSKPNVLIAWALSGLSEIAATSVSSELAALLPIMAHLEEEREAPPF